MKPQTKLVLEHMKKNRSITSLEAIQAYGITRLGARIWELRHVYGYKIASHPVRVKTRAGEAVISKYFFERGAK